MKKILHITLALAAAASLFSCSKLNQPVKFDDSRSFIAFSQYTYNVAENAGTLSIPVTLSSASGITATVAFTTIDSSAKKGVDFEVIGDGTLSFNSDKRTDTIKLKITDNPGVYTKDKIFFLTLEPALGSGVSKGYNDTVVVAINDLDHPLTPILGDYATVAGSDSWTLTLKKDANDDHKVWIYDIACLASIGWAADDMMYYGVVDDDLTKITVPIGQDSEYKYNGTTPITLYGCDGKYVYDEGNVTFAISKEGGISMKSDNGFYLLVGEYGYLSYVAPYLECVKK